MTELSFVASQLEQAVSYLDVFGRVEGDVADQADANRSTYRKLVRVVHPDYYASEADKRVAQAAFVRLQAFKQAAETALADGRFGEAPTLATISTKKHTYRVHKAVGGDSFTNWFAADRGADTKLTLHVAKVPAKNSQVTNAASTLRKLYGADTEGIYRPYLPDMVDSFAYRKSGVSRSALAFTAFDSFVSLETVNRQVPLVHPLDMAWMWRRLLVPIGFAHQSGVVHGAVLPPNILIQPADHGLVLAGWYGALTSDDNHYGALTTGLADYKDWYPKEVLNKQPVSPATDIAMAAKSMVWLMGGNPRTGDTPVAVPTPIRAFFKGCLQGNQQARPQNAWALINEFDELLERLGRPYWPRKFRPFTAVHV